MPKKSTKSKSKRQTLRQKHKIIRKVKEHHKKKNKEAKKLGKKPQKVKDPGIPAQWPFKQELIKEMEWQKQRILHQEQQKKDARKAAKAQQRPADAVPAEEAMPQALSMQDVQTEAKRKRQDFEADQAVEEQPRAGRDSSRKAFFKDFARVVEAADVILHVLDARDPIATRSTDMEQYVRKAGPDKRVVLLLNKIDLVPREAAEAWLKRLREEVPTLAFKCSTQSQRSNLAHRKMAAGHRKKPEAGKGWQRKKGLPVASAAQGGVAAESAWQGSQCLGADTLMQLLKNYARSSGIKTAITVGVVGVPNVGKSSLINSLVRARATQTGNAPGVTRVAQTIHLDKHLTLLDSPGLVLGPAHAATSALHSFTKVEQVEDPVTAVQHIMSRCPAKALMQLYKVPSFASTDEFLQRIASSRGKLLPGGIGDSQAAARIVLQDWNDGRIAYYTLPPPRNPDAAESAELVSAPAAEFDAEAAYGAEGKAVIAELQPLAGSAAEEGNGAKKRAAWFEAQHGAPVQIANLDGDEEDDLVQADSEDEAAKSRGAKGAQSASQTQALYHQPGQFNPHAARAERKRAKKESRGGLITSHAADALADMMLGGGRKDMSDDEEYDFEEAFEGEGDGQEMESEGSEQGSEEDDEDGSIDDGDVSVEDLA